VPNGRVLIRDSLHHWTADDHLLTKAAGVSFENEDHVQRQEIIARCRVGDRLTLKPEPGNRFDPHAVAVLTAAGEQIGYLKRERAAELAEFFSLHEAIPAVITEVTGGTPEKPTRGVNIEAEIPPDLEAPAPARAPIPERVSGTVSASLLAKPPRRIGLGFPIGLAVGVVLGLMIPGLTRVKPPAQSEVSATAPAPEIAGPIGLRGYTLGMTRADFLAAPFPDKDTRRVRAACTGDKLPGAGAASPDLRTSADLQRIAAKLCKFVYFSRNAQLPALSDWFEAAPEIGDVGPLPTAFYFTPKGDNPSLSDRLFMIVIRGDTARFAALSASFRARYGAPRSVSTAPVHNAMGASLDSQVLVWGNATGEIKIEERSERVDTLVITYLDARLWQEITRRLEAQAKSAAGKL
jgi:HIRAN domain